MNVHISNFIDEKYGISASQLKDRRYKELL